MKCIISGPGLVILGILFLGIGGSVGCSRQSSDKAKPPAVADKPIALVLVEGGTFDMGSDISDDEKPVHKVAVKSFMIGKGEVTFAEYDAYCDATGKSRLNDNDWGRGTRPVIHVSWYDAVVFCNWRSQKDGLMGCYTITGTDVTYNTDANGYRLPTEAEWEYAARGGSKSRGYAYSGSNDAGEVGWYDQNSGNSTHQVGEKRANELGLFDMSGNVWEWCWDWYGDKYYSQSPGENPMGPSLGQYRVLRGGCWFGDVHLLRCTLRDGVVFPTSSGYSLGFRVARTSF